MSLLFNHFVELIVPFGILGSRRRWRYGAGLLIAVFQILLITSGNLAWFNWISLVITLACFDDLFFQGLGLHSSVRLQPPLLSHRWRPLLGNLVLFVGLLFLSVKPTINLFLPNQAMNASYDQWHFVNSYGAFGSIGKERLSIVISGSNDGTNWKEYQLPCASDALAKRPCLITPYHYHLDWQMWFSAMRPQLQEEWLFRFAVRLLENHPIIQDSLAEHPFSAKAPKLIKMDLYRYHFGSWEDWPKSWWRREFIRPYLSPISLETPEAKNYLSEPES